MVSSGKNRRPRPPSSRYIRAKGYWIFWELIAKGRLHVDTTTAVVSSKRSPTSPFRPLAVFYCKRGYAFIECYTTTTSHSHRRDTPIRFRRAIAVHRLVWMVASGNRSVPTGYEVHHRGTAKARQRQGLPIKAEDLHLIPKAMNGRNNHTEIEDYISTGNF